MADAEQHKGPLARKLNRLFQTVHPRGRGEYSFAEVAEGIRARGGPTISATYLWQLRTGLRDNPTKQHLEALAGFFGVSPAYFFDEAETERIDAELDLLLALREAGIRDITARLFGVSPGSLRAIAEIVEQVRKLEALPEPGTAPARPGRRPREATGHVLGAGAVSLPPPDEAPQHAPETRTPREDGDEPSPAAPAV